MVWGKGSLLLRNGGGLRPWGIDSVSVAVSTQKTIVKKSSAELTELTTEGIAKCQWETTSPQGILVRCVSWVSWLEFTSDMEETQTAG